MKKIYKCFNYCLSLDIPEWNCSGMRVEAHIIVKRYWQHDYVLGRGPTQTIMILLKGSSNAGMGCK